jgi:hypothetical protein
MGRRIPNQSHSASVGVWSNERVVVLLNGGLRATRRSHPHDIPSGLPIRPTLGQLSILSTNQVEELLWLK